MKMNLNKMISTLVHVVSFVASFWIPLIGLLLWLITKKSNPKNARQYLIAALAGFVINYILTFF